MGLGTLRKSVLEKWSRGVVVKIPWEMMHGYEGQTKELSNLHVMRIYIKDAKGATGNLKIFSTPPHHLPTERGYPGNYVSWTYSFIET